MQRSSPRGPSCPHAEQVLRALPSQGVRDQRELWSWWRAELEDHKADGDQETYQTTAREIESWINAASKVLEDRDRQSRAYGVNRGMSPGTSMRGRFEAVKLAVPVTRFLEERGYSNAWKRAGDRLVMRCPLGFHEDTTPSFTIYPGDRGWYCFGCGYGGTVIDLAMAWRQTTDVRAGLEDVEQIARYDAGLRSLGGR